MAKLPPFRIYGSPYVGSVLRVVGAPAGSSFQWTKAGANIGGQLAASYTIQAGDLGAVIDCIVTMPGVTIVVPPPPPSPPPPPPSGAGAFDFSDPAQSGEFVVFL